MPITSTNPIEVDGIVYPYFMINLAKRKIGIRQLVTITEDLTIRYLQKLNISSYYI